MRSKALVILTVAAVPLALGAFSTFPPTHANANNGFGEWIVRCPATGEVLKEDPLVVSAGGAAEHYHMFFCNTGVAGTGSGSLGANLGISDTATDATMEADTTTAEDQFDTSGVWAPVGFLDTTAGASSNGTVDPYVGSDDGSHHLGCGPQNSAGNYPCEFMPGCKYNTSYYSSATLGTNLDCGTNTDTTEYVRVYYTSVGVVDNDIPDGTYFIVGYPTASSLGEAQSDPNYAVQWDCGADGGANIQTPESAWPYDCDSVHYARKFQQQGLVEIIHFPNCWLGTRHFPAPNGTGMVPGYATPSTYGGPGAPDGPLDHPNDFSYAAASACHSAGGRTIPQVSVRIHYIGLGGEPDAVSPVANFPVQEPGTGTIGPSNCQHTSGITGCTAQQNIPTNEGLLLSADTNADGGPWYTQHDDYWETWQEGSDKGSADMGSLRDLEADCLGGPATDGDGGTVVTCGHGGFVPPFPSN